MSNKMLYVCIGVAVALGVLAYLVQPDVEPDVSAIAASEQTACTMDAKQCPDGTYVPRVAPNCEFAACPEAAESSADINVANPQPGQVVAGSLFVVGEAIGPWYFEANLTVEVRDWQNNLVEETYVTALSDWMTIEMIPFSGQITFTNPYTPGAPAAQKAGTIVFKKANPSGEPQNDDEYIVPIQFAP